MEVDLSSGGSDTSRDGTWFGVKNDIHALIQSHETLHQQRTTHRNTHLHRVLFLRACCSTLAEEPPWAFSLLIISSALGKERQAEYGLLVGRPYLCRGSRATPGHRRRVRITPRCIESLEREGQAWWTTSSLLHISTLKHVQQSHLCRLRQYLADARSFRSSGNAAGG